MLTFDVTLLIVPMSKRTRFTPHRTESGKRATRHKRGVVPMKFHEYKLAGAGIPKELVGRKISVHVAESYEDATSLSHEGDPMRWLALGNQQFILNEERAAKAVAESKEITDLVAAGKVEEAFAIVQKTATDYRDGGRKAGVPSETKVKASQYDTAKAKLAAMSPEQRDKQLKALAALGFSFEV